MAGKATAVDVLRGLKRRFDRCRRQYAPWLPWKLDEALSVGVNPTLPLLQDMLLLPPPAPVPGDELGTIKGALYELEDLLDDLDEHAGVRRRPGGRPTWKRNNDAEFKLHHQHANPQHEKYKEMVGVNGATIIGRDTEKQYLKDLLSQSNPDDLSILPIVGLPGLGKTSLARLVFEDKEEGWDFDLRIWIHVDDNFDLEKFAVCIISEANKLMKGKFSHILNRSDCPSYLKFKDCIEEILSSSSCLIVLDGLLYANEHWLPDLKYALGETKHKCTRFIVTTSSEEVAQVMLTVPSYKLGGLSEDDCWTLFSEKAFGSRDATIHSWQTKIGKAIVKRCMGMPILAQSLGLMVQNQDMETWLAAGNDELWELVERHSLEREAFSSFKQIYYDMSLMLKSCFLYLSVFPRGSDIDKDELIRQWIALDLINSSRHGTLPAFLHGEMFIEALVSRSFLQIVNTSSVTEKKCKNPPPTILKVHSLVYDFLRYIAADDIFTLDYAKSPNISVRNQPFRYAVLTNYSWQAKMHEDFIAKAKAAKAAIFRNCEATMPTADIFPILRYSRTQELAPKHW
uniref:NBS-LRR-like resistance protein n=1 Tax=Oryza sativa TaxID=4530 RepID=A0A0U2QTA1_ORYSA|nr:NBS-LRR-like resistance protein [Oryza sativa]